MVHTVTRSGFEKLNVRKCKNLNTPIYLCPLMWKGIKSGDQKVFFSCFGARNLVIGFYRHSSDLYTGGAILVSMYWMIMDPHIDTIRGGGGSNSFGGHI